MDYYFQKTIIDLLTNILEENKRMSVQMDALVEEVRASITVQEGVLILLDTLTDRLNTVIAELQAQAVDTAELEVITADLAAERQKVAEAVVEHTP